MQKGRACGVLGAVQVTAGCSNLASPDPLRQRCGQRRGGCILNPSRVIERGDCQQELVRPPQYTLEVCSLAEPLR